MGIIFRAADNLTIERDELMALSAEELAERLDSGSLSVLASMGADDLRREMTQVGNACRTLIDYVCLEKDDAKLRKRASVAIRATAPAVLTDPLPLSDDAIVIGFNHPSLGEIFRLMYLGFEAYGNRKFLFPVNLPWYESLTPAIPKLHRLGIYIVPMITPSTEKKLCAKADGDPEKLADVQHFKVIFERRYMRTARSMAKEGCVIFVAPSATRQATVFESPEASKGETKVHPTMTLLARMILRDKEARAVFVPVTVFEPRDNDRKLNLFKRYIISPCKPFSPEETREMAFGSRDFDYMFLKKIEDKYMNKHDVCPVCGSYVFTDKYDICPACGWEHDAVQEEDPDFAGGANKLSLNQAIAEYERRKLDE